MSLLIIYNILSINLIGKYEFIKIPKSVISCTFVAKMYIFMKDIGKNSEIYIIRRVNFEKFHRNYDKIFL